MDIEEAKMDFLTNPTKAYPRSNARARYGKATGGQATTRVHGGYRRRSQEEVVRPVMPFKQRIIFQAIICGCFLAVLLFFNIMDTSFTNGVMSWIDRNISYDMIAEEGGISGWMDSVMGIFDNEAVDEMPLQNYNALYEGTEIVPIQATPQANTVDSSRVDENILRDISSAVDMYYENNRP